MSEVHFCSECQNSDCPEEMPDPNGAACRKFVGVVMTNGDVIRQMSNKELAKRLSDPCSMCVYNVDLQCERLGCEQDIEAWLNAPAESEGEDE